jgi:hypothetical protein
MAGNLPQTFEELEKWSSWALATEGERYAKRAASSMQTLVDFYSALKPHMGRRGWKYTSNPRPSIYRSDFWRYA